MSDFYAPEMDKKSLKLLFSAGDLQNAEVVPQPLFEGKERWVIQFRRRNGATVSLEDSAGNPKWFGKIGTACEWARDIGFKNISVFMPDNPKAKQVPPSESFSLN